MRNFVAAGFSALALLSAVTILVGFGFDGLATAHAGPRAVYFVAVNGNDNGPGTAARPWATLNHAAEQAKAGDTVVVRGGHYLLAAQVRPRHSGLSDAWITFIGYPGEQPILDGRRIPHASLVHEGLDNGVFQIEDVSFVRVADLTVTNSHDAGFTVRDSSNIDLINNSTKETFSSGIAVWDTNHQGKSTRHIRVLGNNITQATTWDMAPPETPRKGEPPHEALSIGGAVDFEVAYNHVYDSDKEGIDIKETSKQGRVYRNLVGNQGRQGIYVDAWFGSIANIEIYANVVHHCHGAGLALSVENGSSVANIGIHNNLIFNNDGSGLYFSRWGADHERRNIQIYNNTFYHNGYGAPADGQTYYWMTGGLYLYSTNLSAIAIRDNIFSDNRGFQIGYSELFLKNSRSWQAAAAEKKIKILGNVIDGPNDTSSPIESGGYPKDRVEIYAVNGVQTLLGNPLFRAPGDQDFSLRDGSPAARGRAAAGAYASATTAKFWWKRNFPPALVHVHFGRSGVETSLRSPDDRTQDK